MILTIFELLFKKKIEFLFFSCWKANQQSKGIVSRHATQAQNLFLFLFLLLSSSTC